MKKRHLLLLTTSLLFSVMTFAQKNKNQTEKTPFVWEGANLYFLMTDRFNNGDPTNDHNYNRTKKYFD